MRWHANSDDLTRDANADRDCLLSAPAAVSDADRYDCVSDLAASDFNANAMTDKLLGRFEAWTASDGTIRFVPLAPTIPASTLSLVWPCDYRPAQVKYPYGEKRKDFDHEGVDIVTPMGSVVRAPVIGEIFQASEWGFYGKRVAIRFLVGDKQYEVYLAHLSRIYVRMGQIVAASEQVGLSGNSGNSTGPHLHLTLRDPSNPLVLRGIKATFNGCIDPQPYLVMP